VFLIYGEYLGFLVNVHLSDIPHTFIPHFTLATHCLILGVGFRVKLSDQDIAEIECLMVVAMATNFGTKIATGFV